MLESAWQTLRIKDRFVEAANAWEELGTVCKRAWQRIWEGCSRQSEQHRHRAETCLSAASIGRDLRQFRFREGKWKARNETGRRSEAVVFIACQTPASLTPSPSELGGWH